ncbi:alpha-ketoacid dehydrogenase subunit beta [Streptomyces albidus (ex Kaewkla and Franco 2022)]|uniref:alpha-ketoacid dehydrogenase subunit beta n=1 Tax=Streptomyces albidus (ex Kaewkla and Franco 2022) TaxID=722709 RepID=UPI001B354B72|nr:transketolase C-terminal domain-containing protein [Streptomyces albidus (ex Kaewkla and Franco 2022)]
MPRSERVVENLNAALHRVFAEDESAYLIGEDLADPYGGAFKVGKGLSTKYPGRVLSTPLSESGFVGVANGLALTGNTVFAEIMFGDFAFLAFDQLCNFAAKSVSMYGSRQELRMVVRCPVGGHRGYGPTHSQAVQKHFMGVPNLALYELTPFHDSADVFAEMVGRGEPCIHFEDKTLYGTRRWTEGTDDLFEFGFAGARREYGTAQPRVGSGDADCVIIATGGTAPLALQAARKLFLEAETVCRLVVPSRLYPLDLSPVEGMLARARRIVVVEEGVAGGTWGADVAQEIYERMWESLSGRVRLVHSDSSVIPSAAHLEREVLVQAEDIEKTVREALAR